METTATTTAPASNTTGSGPGIFISESMVDNSGSAGSNGNTHQMAKLRRDSIAHSQGIGGVSWGSLTISSWLRDEVMIHAQSYGKDHGSLSINGHINVNGNSSGHGRAYPINVQNSNDFLGKHGNGNVGGGKSPLDLTKFASPPGSSGAYLPNLEKQYCKDYSCCGQLLPSLHDLLRHYEEAHIATSPGSHSNGLPSHHNNHGHVHHPMNPNMVGVNMNFNLQSAAHASSNNGNHHSQSKNTSSAAMSNANSSHSNSHLHSHLNQHASGSLASNNMHGQLRSGPDHHNHAMQQEHLSSNGVNYQQRKAILSQQRMQQQHQSNNNTNNINDNNNGNNNNTINGSQHPRKSDHRLLQSGSGLTGSGQSQSKVPRGSQINTSSSSSNLTSLSQSGQSSASTNQLHLNGGFVDAVSTNEVFLQSKHSQPSSSRNVSNFNSYSTKSHQTMVQPASKRSLPLGSGLDLDYMEAGVISGLNDSSLGGVMGFGSIDPLSHNVPLTNTNQLGLSKKSKKLTNSHMKMKGIGRQDSDSGLLGDHESGVVIGEDDDDDDEVVDEDEDDEDDHDDEDNVLSSRKQQGYIDDPARRLYVMDHEEHKPFKCPVIGCDKTYKNQNGLKYHKLHGHQNQKLHENPDGTFSIIDPESNEPYPDGMGMENDKPYRCEVCGKRYKNLNGLKYHRGHSTH